MSWNPKLSGVEELCSTGTLLCVQVMPDLLVIALVFGLQEQGALLILQDHRC